MNVYKKIAFVASLLCFLASCTAHAGLINRFEVYSVSWGEYAVDSLVIENPVIFGPLPFGNRQSEMMMHVANGVYANGMFASGGHMFAPGKYENPAIWTDFEANGPRMSLTFLGRGYSYLLPDSYFEVLSATYDNTTSLPTSFDVIGYQHGAAEWGMPAGHMFMRFTWNIEDVNIGDSLFQRAQAALVPEPSTAAIGFGALLLISRLRQKK